MLGVGVTEMNKTQFLTPASSLSKPRKEEIHRKTQMIHNRESQGLRERPGHCKSFQGWGVLREGGNGKYAQYRICNQHEIYMNV